MWNVHHFKDVGSFCLLKVHFLTNKRSQEQHNENPFNTVTNTLTQMFVLKYFFEDKIANQKHFKVSHGSSWLTPIKKKKDGKRFSWTVIAQHLHPQKKQDKVRCLEKEKYSTIEATILYFF